MPAGLNVALQFLALLCAAAIRLARPGWMLVAMIVFIFPVVVLVLPTALALGTARWGTLSPPVAVPFVASALGLLAVAAIYPDLDDATWWVPAPSAVGVPRPLDWDAAHLVGNLALLGYVAVLLWTIVAITSATERTRRKTTMGGGLPPSDVVR